MKVWRGGVSTRYIGKERYTASFSLDQTFDEKVPSVQISLKLDSKGGGTTRVFTFIEPDDFEKLATVMVRANSKKALKAFGKAIIKSTEGDEK